MKKRIYLFCNNDYGRRYIQTFQLLAQQHPDIECIAVFSTRLVLKNWLRKIKRTIQIYITNNYFGHLEKFVFMNGFLPLMVENVNHPDFVKKIPEDAVGFVAGFNQIFAEPIIHQFKSLINFHPSLLPYYRGAIPSYWVIKNNEQLSGFTAHKISPKIDAGEIIYQEVVTVDPGMDEHNLDQKIASAGAMYFASCLNSVISGEPYKTNIIVPGYTKKEHYTSSKRS